MQITRELYANLDGISNQTAANMGFKIHGYKVSTASDVDIRQHGRHQMLPMSLFPMNIT